MKAEWARLALVGNAAPGLDQVEAVRPAGVGTFNLVVETIDDCGKLDAESAYAGVSHGKALLLVTRASKEHLVTHIALHLPNVSGMRLEDVDGVKVYLTLVLLRQLVQGGNLPPKRGSSIASKDQHDRPSRP